MADMDLNRLTEKLERVVRETVAKNLTTAEAELLKALKTDSALLPVLLAITKYRTEEHPEQWGIDPEVDGTGGEVYEVLAASSRIICDQAIDQDSLTWQHLLLETVYKACAETEPLRMSDDLERVAAVVLTWLIQIRRRQEKNR